MAAMRVESIADLRARKADRRTEADDLRMELLAVIRRQLIEARSTAGWSL